MVMRTTIAFDSTTTAVWIVKSAPLTSEVVAYYENSSDESHISEGQELSAICRRSASGALEASQ